MRSLKHLEQYAYDWRQADCSNCELAEQRASTFCPSQRPAADFCGLMIVGEGPGSNEARLKTPFIGPSGALLDRVLTVAGLARSTVWVANATACQPPTHPKSLHEDFPNAIPSCLPRLETEIDAVRPRVILALGSAALHALTGRRVEYDKRVPLDCHACEGALTLPWWQCRECSTVNYVHPRESKSSPICVQCRWEPTALQLAPRKKKCPLCDGKKTKTERLTKFVTEHKISQIAGGVFHAEEFGWPEGVRYIIPTYHPAHLLRKAETKAGKFLGGQFLVNAFVEHVKKAARLLHEEADPDPPWELISSSESAKLSAYIERFSDAKFFAVDIETDAKEPFDVTEIRCVGIRADTAGYAVVCSTTDLPTDAALFQDLKGFLSNPIYPKCFQNGIYDTQTIWRVWGYEVEGWQYDTLVAHSALAPDEPHKLEHIVFTYTDAKPWKPAKKEGGVPKFDSDHQLYEYNARDVYNTAIAMQRMLRELVAERAELVHKLDVAKLHVARGMDRAGLPISQERHAFWSERSSSLRQAALVTMQQVAGANFNPNSSQQLSQALFDPSGPCRFVPSKFTDKGQPSADAAAILALRGTDPAFVPESAFKFLDALLQFRRWDKIRGTYIEGMAVDADWRLRARWNSARDDGDGFGARTGRWSSSPNLANWPGADPQDPAAPNMRAMVVAPPGRKLGGADMAQAELRVFAALSGDEDLISLCKNADESDKLNPEKDPHSSVAALAFPEYLPSFRKMRELGDASEESKKYKSLCKAYREVAKMVIYAMLYAAGAEKIWQGIYDKGYEGPAISVEQVQRVMNAFFARYKSTLAYRERTLLEAQRSGYVRDALINRHRIFPLKDVDATVAANFAIQATVASMMDFSIIEFATRLPSVDPSAFIIAQVHDAIYWEASEDRAERVSALLEECMSQEIQLVPGAPWMPFIATGKIGDSWDQVS